MILNPGGGDASHGLNSPVTGLRTSTVSPSMSCRATPLSSSLRSSPCRRVCNVRPPHHPNTASRRTSHIVIVAVVLLAALMSERKVRHCLPIVTLALIDRIP